MFVGVLNSSSEAVVVTEQGTAIETQSPNARRIPESGRWDADRILGIRAVPWSPDGRAGASLPGRSADGKQSSKDLPLQSRLRAMGSQ